MWEMTHWTFDDVKLYVYKLSFWDKIKLKIFGIKYLSKCECVEIPLDNFEIEELSNDR